MFRLQLIKWKAFKLMGYILHTMHRIGCNPAKNYLNINPPPLGSPLYASEYYIFHRKHNLNPLQSPYTELIGPW